MVKTLIPALIMIATISSCSSLKPIGTASNNNQHQVVRTTQNTSKPNSQNKEVKFLEDISVNATPAVEKKVTAAPKKDQPTEARHAVNTTVTTSASGKSSTIE